MCAGVRACVHASLHVRASIVHKASLQCAWIQIRRGVDRSLCMPLQEYSNWPTYPQLYAGGELLGGCDIILELHASHQLKESIAEALGEDPPQPTEDGQTALHVRLKKLIQSRPVMLFMKVRWASFWVNAGQSFVPNALLCSVSLLLLPSFPSSLFPSLLSGPRGKILVTRETSQ